jgi:hypothetical protein
VITDAYGDRRAAQVMEATWGHLRPASGRHDGHVVAARSEFGGERVLLTADFGDVDDSPWLFESLTQLVDEADMPEGSVYRFDGALVVDGNGFRFEGRWVRIWATEQVVAGEVR